MTNITMINKINLIVLFGLYLGASNILYGMKLQLLHDQDDKKENTLHIAQPSTPRTPVGHKKYTSGLGWTCRSIETCKALPIVIACLRKLENLDDFGGLVDISDHLSLSADDETTYLVNAWHHLLCQHLDSTNSQDHYAYIHQVISKKISCDVTSCAAYARNQRKRGEDDQDEEDDQEGLFVRDFLDSIHAYLLHANSSGHRYLKPPLKRASKKIIYKVNKRPKDDLSNDELRPRNSLKRSREDVGGLFERNMKILKNWQQPIRKQQHSDRGSRFQTTNYHVDKNLISLELLKARFSTNKMLKPWITYVLLPNNCDTDCLLEEIKAHDNKLDTVIPIDGTLFGQIKKLVTQQAATVAEKANKESISYFLGKRLYYWDYYKNSNRQDHYHKAYKQKALYVAPAYTSFKQEILSKKVPIRAWHQKIYEAEIILRQSTPLKNAQAETWNQLCSTYDMDTNKGLAVPHVLSVLLYTNFEYLCTAFSRSFRLFSATKNIESLLARNAKWHYLAKHLRETVEIFGEEIGYSQWSQVDKGGFYHGVTNVAFPPSSAPFYGPLSTSKQLSVALLFTDNNGLILELAKGCNDDDKYLRYFNASLLSPFPAEDERLFIGGQYPMQIPGIRLIKDNANTKPLMHTLWVLGKMLSGVALSDEKVTRSDIIIFKKLLSSYKSLPMYVQKIWLAFKNEQQTIRIDIPCIRFHYDLLASPITFSPKKIVNNNLLLLNKIVTIFPNVTEIICEYADVDITTGSFSRSLVSSSFVQGLKDIIVRLHPPRTLKKIIINTYIQPIHNKCDLYAKEFDALGWHIKKEHASSRGGGAPVSTISIVQKAPDVDSDQDSSSEEEYIFQV